MPDQTLIDRKKQGRLVLSMYLSVSHSSRRSILFQEKVIPHSPLQ
jgi:hypothetical protein